MTLSLPDLISSAAPWTQRHSDVAIAYDLFPAEVILPDPVGNLGRSRLIAITAPAPTLFVFADTSQGPAAVIEAPYDPSLIYGDVSKGLDFYAGLDDANPQIASVVSVRPMSGCGCGSRLRSFDPFTTMRHTSAPIPAGPLPAPPVA